MQLISINIIGKWKTAEADSGRKSLSSGNFNDLILDLDETSDQMIVETAVDNEWIEIIHNTDPPAMIITKLYGHKKCKTFHCIY